MAVVRPSHVLRGRGRSAKITLAASLTALSIVHGAYGAGKGVQVDKVARGSAQFQVNGPLTTIRAADRTIINYKFFNIDQGQTVRFVQPSSRSRVLNRIAGTEPSQINGVLQANGIVYFVNPSGITFGPHSVLDVGQIYAAGGSITDANFLANINRFALSAPVSNSGSITGQQVHLLGTSVANEGAIKAEGGLVSMVAGDDVTLGTRDGHIMVKVGANAVPQTAAGGSNLMGAGDMYSFAIKNSGSVKASDVHLESQGTGQTVVSGTIDASNNAKGATGGQVVVTGGSVALKSATIDASGTAGGGKVLVGGDMHGQGDTRNATVTTISPDSLIRADALSSGNGGMVIVWSDQLTQFSGAISARGGEIGGDGGFAEVSGKRLGYSGTVDLKAPKGKGGNLLIDPFDLGVVDDGTPGAADLSFGLEGDVVADGDTAAYSLGDNGPSLGLNVHLQVSAITDVLKGGQTVTLAAEHNLTIDSAINVASSIGAGGAGLNLRAGNDLTINQPIDLNAGVVDLHSNDPTLGFGSGVGNVTINAPINTHGGSFHSAGVGFDNSNNGTLTVISASFDHTGNVKLAHAGDLHLSSSTVGGSLTVTNTTNVTVDAGQTISAGGPASFELTDPDSKFAIGAGGSVQTTSGGVTVTADKMALAGAISASGQPVTLQTATTGTAIDLGSNVDTTANTLELSSTELNNITSSSLQIGRNDSSASGNITVSNNIGSGATWTTLSLVTGSSISGAGTITADSLALQATSGIGTLLNPLSTSVDSIAASNTTSGDVAIANANPLLVTAVGGVSGISSAASVAVVSTGSMTIDVPVTAVGDISLQAGDTASLGLSDDVIINANVISFAGGTVDLIAGDNIIQNAGSVIAGLARFTADHEGAGVADGFRGSITQVDGAVIADSAVFRSFGDVAMNSSTNSISTIAASITAGKLTYNDSGSVAVGLVDSVDGITTSGDVTFATDSLAITSPVVTNGGHFSTSVNNDITGSLAGTINTSNTADGSNAGAVDLTAGNSISLAGSITTTGTDSALGTGGSGGNVTFISDNIATAAITTSGGSATAGNADGGNAGSIVYVGSATLNGNLIAAAGAPSGAGTNGSSGGIDFIGPVVIGQNVTMSASAVNFDNTLDAAHDGVETLQVNADTNFLDIVGGTTPLKSLTVTGFTSIEGGAVTTKGDQTYSGGMDIAVKTATLNTNGGNLSITGLTGHFDGISTVPSQNLILASGIGSGLTTFNGNVDNIGTGTGAAITIQDGVTGLVEFKGTLAANSGLVAQDNNFTSSVKFNANVTLADGDTATSLPGNVTIDAASFSGFDGLTLGHVTLVSNSLLLNSNGSNIQLTSVNGAGNDLTLNPSSTGTITVTGNVGTVAQLTIVDSKGATFQGDTSVGAFTATNSGSAYDVAFNMGAGGQTTSIATATFNNTGRLILGNNAADQSTFFNGLDVMSGGGHPSQTVAAGTVTTLTQPMVFGPFTLGADTTLNSNGQNITIPAFDAASHNLILATGIGSGTTTFTGPVTNLGSGTGAALTIQTGVTGLVDFQDTLSGTSGLVADATTNVRFTNTVTLADGDTATNLAGAVTFNGITFSGFDGLSFGALTLATGPVSLNSNGGSIQINSLTAAGNNLTLDAGATGTITVAGNVDDLPLLTITNSNGASFQGSFGTTTPVAVTIVDSQPGAAITFQGDTQITTLTATGSSNAYDVALNVGFGGQTTTITNAVFNNTGAVTLGNDSTDQITFPNGLDTVSGVSHPFITNLAGLVTTASQTLSLGNAALTADTVLDSTGQNIAIGAVGGNAHNLILADGIGAGSVTFSGAVQNLGTGIGDALLIQPNVTGPVTFATSLATNSGIAANSTDSDVRFTGVVALGDGDTGTNLPGNVSFTSVTLTSFDGLNLGQVTLSGAPTSIDSNGADIHIQTLTTTGANLILAAGIGAGTTTFVGDVTNLGSGTGPALTVQNGVTGQVLFNGLLAGNAGLSAPGASSDIRFTHNVTLGNGDTGTTLAGAVTLNGITFSGFDGLNLGNVTLTTGTSTLNSNGSNITIASLDGGSQNLILAAGIGAGTTTFTGNVTSLGSGTGAALTVQSGVTGLVRFEGTVAANSGLSAPGADSDIQFDHNVTLADGDTATNLAGNVSMGAITFAGFDGLTFGSLNLLGGATAITSSDDKDITITSAVGGDTGQLTVNTAAKTIFNGPVTIASLTTNAGGSTQINGGSVTTSLGQTYNDDVLLGDDTIITQTAASAGVLFAGTVNDKSGLAANKGDLTMNVAGTSTFTGAVGNLAPLGSGTGAAITINSTGPTIFNSTVAIASGFLQDAAAGVVQFHANVTAGVSATGSVFNSNVSLLNGMTFTSGGDVTFGSDASDFVTLGGSAVTINTSTANKKITINSWDPLESTCRHASLSIL